jgi:hypothetical protein
MSLPEADLDEGYRKYHFLCSRCHGEFGEGETGPAIINRDFLEAAGDRFLYRTIAEGRAHTAMFGWSTDVYNKEKLGVQDISDIIGYMRISSTGERTYIFPGRNPGNREAGAEVFADTCWPPSHWAGQARPCLPGATAGRATRRLTERFDRIWWLTSGPGSASVYAFNQPVPREPDFIKEITLICSAGQPFLLFHVLLVRMISVAYELQSICPLFTSS